MAGGPLLPSSVYLGQASGNLSPQFYIGTVATGSNAVANFSALEGVAVVGSLASGTNYAVLQFNMPETIPTGIMKIRVLAMASATSGAATFAVHDAVTSAGAAIGASNFTIEATQTVTWAAGNTDQLLETKQALTPTPLANQILTCAVYFAPSVSFTVTAQSVWQFSIVWE